MSKKIKNLKPGRDGIWQVIRTLKSFTVQDIQNYVDMDHTSIRTYLSQLEAGGFLTSNSPEPFQKKIFELVKDNGYHRPVLKADGNPKKPSANQRMWMCMKALKKFSYLDVSITAEVPKYNAKTYLSFLNRAGYVGVFKEAQPPISPGVYIFKASNDTGPKAPQIRKDKSVYDQNLHKVVWRPAGGAA